MHTLHRGYKDLILKRKIGAGLPAPTMHTLHNFAGHFFIGKKGG